MNKNTLLNQSYICPMGADGVHGWHEARAILTAMDRRKNESTTENPESVSRLEILGLTGSLLPQLREFQFVPNRATITI
jgi:hypothetical protein